jgi:hypothetical protein
MANRPIRNIGRDLRARFERDVKQSVSNAHRDVIARSPVDTGRFRSSWIHNEDGDTDAMTPENKAGRYPQRPPVAPAQVDAKKEQLLINNLPYATRLCMEGWSKKAAPDWFTSIGQRWQTGQYFAQANRESGDA